jgi:FKBP-type peptidyl-prolyl cis-trans isomerase SlyD
MTDMPCVADDVVVAIDYILTDPAGAVIDQSEAGQPLSYLHGHHNLVPGLERALLGKTIDDQLDVVVTPADGYGEPNPDLVVTLPREGLSFQVKVGDLVRAEAGDGQSLVLKVVSLDDEHVTLDGNHPLAGRELHFAVKVVGLRPATADELAHGHVHDGEAHAD